MSLFEIEVNRIFFFKSCFCQCYASVYLSNDFTVRRDFALIQFLTSTNNVLLFSRHLDFLICFIVAIVPYRPVCLK